MLHCTGNSTIMARFRNRGHLTSALGDGRSFRRRTIMGGRHAFSSENRRGVGRGIRRFVRGAGRWRDKRRSVRRLREDVGCRHRSRCALHEHRFLGRQVVLALEEDRGRHRGRWRRQGPHGVSGRGRQVCPRDRELRLHDSLSGGQLGRVPEELHVAQAVKRTGDALSIREGNPP